MKQYNLFLAVLVSCFLLNCGNTGQAAKSGKSSTLRPDEETLINSIKNEQLRDAMRQLVNGVSLEDPDFLLLALDEGNNEETQIKILNFFITRAKGKTPQKDIHPVVFQAIEKKKNKIFAFLLTRVSIDYKATDKDRTLLHAAVATASKETVQAVLLKNGDLINTNTATHGTPLHYLLEVPFTLDGKPTNDINTRKEILELLLQNGKIKLTTKNRNNHTAGQLATILATQNEEAAKTADTNLKKTYEDRHAFYKWAAEEIAARATTKH